jgi:DNA primase
VQLEKDAPVIINEELRFIVAAALDYVSGGKEKLFALVRQSLEISELEDVNAKEIFIALEECIRYGEAGIDKFLARIQSSELREFIVKRCASEEFFVNARQFVMDGIKRIKERRLKQRQEEIVVKLREQKKDGKAEDVRELLAEKMQIDSDLAALKQGI